MVHVATQRSRAAVTNQYSYTEEDPDYDY